MDAALEVLGLTLKTNADAVAAAVRATDGSHSYSPLAALAATRTLSLVIDDTMRALVNKARHEGATWQDIGAALGTTRQAAYQRFGPHMTGEDTEMEDTPMKDADERALSILDRYTKKDWSICDEFNDTMTERLSSDLLAASFDQITTAAGAFETFGSPVARQMQGHTVVDVPMTFAAGAMKGRVAFDNSGQVAGLFILNPEVP